MLSHLTGDFLGSLRNSSLEFLWLHSVIIKKGAIKIVYMFDVNQWLPLFISRECHSASDYAAYFRSYSYGRSGDLNGLLCPPRSTYLQSFPHHHHTHFHLYRRHRMAARST
ncbi:ETS domain-containing protein Elk-4-like X8, partial [Biomphalaria glabrata]